MEKFIQVYDNILPKDIEDYIERAVLYNSNLDYKYLFNATGGTSPPYDPALNHHFYPDKVNHFPTSLFLNVISYFVANQNIILEELINGRIFLTLPPPNPKLESIHLDRISPHWVCLYYVNDSDGDTVFFNDDKKTEIKRVSPKKGRIAFFDGSINHSGTQPSKNPRAIINYNFIGKKL